MKSTKIVSDMLWRFGERICAQLVSFIVSIVLARILLPSEYGIIARTTVFITICNVFVTSGFGMALIQKEKADELDFSTIFVFGISFSTLLYIILFFAAPLIAEFYGEPILIPVVRVMSLKLPMAAINSVQQAYVSRKMLFRKFFWATLIGTIISGIIGILMAFWGFGVWALVVQYLINTFIDTIILGISVHWFPGFRFSFDRLTMMVGFGWRILVSDLISTVYNELRSLIIGKKYTSDQLAYYNRGQQLPHLFVTNVGVAISSVLFPTMSREQTDKDHLKTIVNRSICIGTYIMFPIMTGLAVCAKPIILILLTDKWIFAVPFLQMACFSYAFEPWSSANLQAIKASGAAGDYLKLEIEKKSVALILLFASVPFGVIAIAASACVYSIIAIALTAHCNSKNINYGFWRQCRDIVPNFIICVIMGACTYIITLLKIGLINTLILQVLTGFIVYVVLSIITKNGNYVFTKSLLLQFFKKKG